PLDPSVVDVSLADLVHRDLGTFQGRRRARTAQRGLRGHVGAASTQDPVLQQTVDQGPRIGDCVLYAGKFGDPHQRTGQGSRSRIAHKPTLRGGNTRKPRTGTLDRSSCSVDRSPTVRRVPAGTRRLADTPRFTGTGDTRS